MPGTTELSFFAISFIILLFLLWAAVVSKRENEKRASMIFGAILFVVLVFDVSVLLIENHTLTIVSLWFVLIILVLGFVLILPFKKSGSYDFIIPKGRIDERDVMFSRNELKVGTDDFTEYYARKPENKLADDNFRKLPGLLSNTSREYNPFHFASSNASFSTVGAFDKEVEADVNSSVIPIIPEEISNYIKVWAKKLGALDCGITYLHDYHIYSHGGRKERRGKVFNKKHKFAIAFTVEMEKEMVDAAPKSVVVMESGQQYLEAGRIAIQLTKFIGNIGYEARAHIDGNYEVVCPLVARDAGLGEIGRMGILMTPKRGPRVRIAVVTTNIPLIVDIPKPDYSVIDFCTICKKCAHSCPSQAISFNDREEINGVLRWQINQEHCFTLWCKLGTDCSHCLSVCPYSHENNALHNLIRLGIRNNYVFRRLALKMDDVFYGKKPKPKDIPKDLRI